MFGRDPPPHHVGPEIGAGEVPKRMARWKKISSCDHNAINRRGKSDADELKAIEDDGSLPL